MTIDVATFKSFIPAMAKTVADPLIQLHLNYAVLEITEDIYGDQREPAVFYLVARRIALDPAGTGARLNPKGGTDDTTYSAHLKEIQKGLVGFCLVASTGSP